MKLDVTRQARTVSVLLHDANTTHIHSAVHWWSGVRLSVRRCSVERAEWIQLVFGTEATLRYPRIRL